MGPQGPPELWLQGLSGGRENFLQDPHYRTYKGLSGFPFGGKHGYVGVRVLYLVLAVGLSQRITGNPSARRVLVLPASGLTTGGGNGAGFARV